MTCLSPWERGKHLSTLLTAGSVRADVINTPTCSWCGNKWLMWHWKDSTGEANKWWFHATKYSHILFKEGQFKVYPDRCPKVIKKKIGHLHVDGLIYCWGKGFYQWIEFRVPHHLIVFLRFGWLTVLSSIKIVEQELYFRDSRPGETFRQWNHIINKRSSQASWWLFSFEDPARASGRAEI